MRKATNASPVDPLFIPWFAWDFYDREQLRQVDVERQFVLMRPTCAFAKTIEPC